MIGYYVRVVVTLLSMVQVKKNVEQRAPVRCLVCHHHGGIVSTKPRISIALASREDSVRSNENGLVYQESVDYLAEQAQYSSSNKQGTLRGGKSIR